PAPQLPPLPLHDALPIWARRAPGRTDVRATGATRGRRRRVRRAVSAGGVGTRPVVVLARKRVDGETGPCRSTVAVVAARLDGCAALVVAQHVDELVLRLVRVAGQPELLGPVAQLVDRPVLVALGVPASATHGALALRGRGVRDPGGLLLRRALVAQRLVHVGLLDRRRGVLAWHGSSFSRALDRTRVPFGAVGSGEGRADPAGGRPPARRRAPTGAPRESPSIGSPASRARPQNTACPPVTPS